MLKTHMSADVGLPHPRVPVQSVHDVHGASSGSCQLVLCVGHVAAKPGWLPFNDEERKMDDATDVEYLPEDRTFIEDVRLIGLGPEMEAVG
jgi:hypothetical protein